MSKISNGHNSAVKKSVGMEEIKGVEEKIDEVAKEAKETEEDQVKANQAAESASTICVVGPGQLLVKCFAIHAAVLDARLRHWRDENAKSYLIPPVFVFQNADVSDEAIRKASFRMKKSLPEDDHRRGDNAEHLMYQAIDEVISRGRFKGPLIAFRSLNMSTVNNADIWNTFFPHQNREEFLEALREYDFLLISPAFGIAVIEVKSSEFRNCMGKQLSKCLAQLKSVFTLVKLLEKCTGILMPPNGVQKIMFLPNANEDRFTTWFEKLTKEEKANVTIVFGNETPESNFKPEISKALVQIFEQWKPVGREVYEAYVPILAGVSSMAVLPSNLICSIATPPDKSNFSVSDSVIDFHQRLISQQPHAYSRPNKLSSLLEAPELVNKLLDIRYITPDQHNALSGPNLQIIFGPAGSGKTVILKAKTIQLLDRGDRVTVIVPECYIPCYQELFKRCGHKKDAYTICSISEEINALLKIVAKIAHKNQCHTTSMKLYHDVCNHVDQMISNGCFPPELKRYLSSDHIIIDDLCDQYSPTLVNRTASYIAYVAMVFTTAKNSNKVVWAACDPLLDGYHETKLIDFLYIMLAGMIQPNVVILKEVLRCTGNIFNAVSYQNYRMPDQDMTPVLGHMIPGNEVKIIQETFDIFYDAKTAMCETIEKELLNLIEQQLSVNWIAIIVIRTDEKVWLQSHFEGLLILKWDETSSFEYPIVIFARCLPLFKPVNHAILEYQSYRAKTRATTMLIDILMTHRKW